MRWGGRGEHDQKNSRFPPPPKMNNVQILQLKKRKFDSSSTIILIFIQNSRFFKNLKILVRLDSENFQNFHFQALFLMENEKKITRVNSWIFTNSLYI